ncbi:DUF4405 domain-containing protein [Desulfovibrio sp. JC010]|uniref:DUF4405 domain-containing protein n=1 Tax=Desulfovibrio sp. JC010 TaxID=2593641 RepID=UPI0027D2D7E4|nr:DUF4405 domain-containing protein [Desulfovibrio sp. JC010]NDV28796.1 DUF4405 domain-containing protein [Desulfovibrio sp. JC010]
MQASNEICVFSVWPKPYQKIKMRYRPHSELEGVLFMHGKNFKFRSFISVLTFISFIILMLTGLELFVAPHDHTTDWLSWSFYGISQDIFAELHIIFGLLFLLTSLIHIAYNLKPLLSYLKKPARSNGLLSEALVALIVSIVITVGTVAGMPGPANIIELGERFQKSWAIGYPEAPMPNTESLSIEQLGLLLQVDPNLLIDQLRSMGISDVDTQAVIEDIAEEHDIPPYKIYTAIKQAK